MSKQSQPEITASKQKYTDEQYLEAGEGYFSPDEEVSHQEYKIVTTRTPHACAGLDHKEEYIIPSGSKSLRETAIHVDNGRISCYVCLACLDDWCADIFPDEEDGDDDESE